MQKKSKTSLPHKRKRSKSIMKKAWATRRANSGFLAESQNLLDVVAAKKSLAPLAKESATTRRANQKVRDFVRNETFVESLTQEGRASLAKGTLTSANAIPRSDSAVLRTLEIARDEQLCAFMGDLWAIRQSQPHNHMPLMISRPQIEAIESFLQEHGYTAWGHATIKAA